MKAKIVPIATSDEPSRQARIEFRRFFMSDQTLALKLATDLDLSKTEWRAWNILLAHMEKGNYVYHTQAFMAEELKVFPTHFYKAIRGLHENDMIAHAADRGKGKSIMVSPFLVWRGGASEHRMAMRQYVSHRKA